MKKGIVTCLKNIALERDIETRISDGEYLPGDMLPPERNIAANSGYSRVTVRMALKNLEKKGLIDRHQGSGTFVSNSAMRKLERNRTPFSICFAYVNVPGKDILMDPYFNHLSSGFHRALNEFNANFRSIEILPGEDPVSKISEKSDTIFDGIIFLSCAPSSDEILQFRRDGTSLVIIGEAPQGLDISSVDIDNFHGAYEAVRHLAAFDRKRILLLNNYSTARRNGFMEAVDEFGIDRKSCHVDKVVPWSKESGRKAALKALSDVKKEFDSMIVYGDFATVGAMEAVKESGLGIPEDISVVMYDDYPWVEMLSLQPTAIRQPFPEQAYEAVKMLIESSRNGEDRHFAKMLQPSLVIRKSTCQYLKNRGAR